MYVCVAPPIVGAWSMVMLLWQLFEYHYYYAKLVCTCHQCMYVLYHCLDCYKTLKVALSACVVMFTSFQIMVLHSCTCLVFINNILHIHVQCMYVLEE